MENKKKRRRRLSKKRRKQIFINRFLLCISIFVILFALVKTYNSKNSIAYNYKEEYLEETKYLAIKTGRKYDLYPSVILAQSALESGYGISELSSKYNNYFGIKANEKEKKTNMITTEFVNGEEIKVRQPFREYYSKKDSFMHYGKLISKAKRYQRVRESKNYKEACYNLQKCGYATDKDYAEKIIYIIENYNLNEIDESK